MRSTISYILCVLRRGGNIIIADYIKLYDENGEFVCCLSESDLQAVNEQFYNKEG